MILPAAWPGKRRFGRARGLEPIMIRNIVLPALAVMCTVLLWAYLSAESTRYGIIWFAIGIAVLLWITRFLRKPLTINMGEETDPS